MGDCCSGCILRSSAIFMTEPVAFNTESGTFSGCALTEMGRFSWSCEGAFSSSLCGVLRNLLIGAPRSGTRLIRRLGAGVTESCTGVFEPGEVLREIFSFGFLFSGESKSLPWASSAVVKALSFMGCGISSSELSISMFCNMGASAAKPCDCDCPNTESGESLRDLIDESPRIRPYDEDPPNGVGEVVAISVATSRNARVVMYVVVGREGKRLVAVGLFAHTYGQTGRGLFVVVMLVVKFEPWERASQSWFARATVAGQLPCTVNKQDLW